MAIPGVGLAKGFATTLKNLFAPKVTRQYPEVRPQLSDRWRGRLQLRQRRGTDHQHDEADSIADPPEPAP